MNSRYLSDYQFRRLFAYVELLPNGCWYWTGGVGGGYPQFDAQRTHILTYRHFIGPYTPELGWELDHTCEVGKAPERRCVNPWCLEKVTASTNMKRAYVSAHARRAAERLADRERGIIYINGQEYRTHTKH